MPYVKIQIARGAQGATADQKEALIKGTSDLLKNVLGKDPASTYVVIEEVSTENWGVGGESIAARAKRTAK